MNNIFFLVRKILSLPRGQRKIILLVLDALLILISLFSSLRLASDHDFILANTNFNYLIIICVGLIVYSLRGQYRSLIFYFGISSLYSIIISNILLVLIVFDTISITLSHSFFLEFCILVFFFESKFVLTIYQRGATTIVICRPSSFGSCSILACVSTAVSNFFNTSKPFL